MSAIRNNEQRAKLAIISGLVYGALWTTTFALNVWTRYIGSSNNEVLSLPGDTGYVRIGLTGAIWLGFIISFIMWFRRAYYNLHIVNPNATFFPEGWAAGAWFVPFTNLNRPYRIMREIWMGTLQVLKNTITIDHPKNLIRAWWVCFVGSLFISFCNHLNFGEVDESVDHIEYKYRWTLVSGVLWIVSLVLVLIIIRKFSKLEQQLKEVVHLPSDSIFAASMLEYNNEQAGN